MIYSNQEYADIVLFYGKANCNAREAQRLYEQAFPQRRLPHRSVFFSTFERLRETGSVHGSTDGRNRGRDTNIESAVLDAVSRDPSTSTRKISRATGISKSQVHRVLKYNEIHPYHYTPVQSLYDGDCQRRQNFCTMMLEKDQNDSDFLKKILWTDESNFSREGIVNYHNIHHYAETNPHKKLQAKHQVKFSVNIWAGVIGKFFFCFS